MTERGAVPEPTELLDRWLAHRDGHPVTAQDPLAEPDVGVPNALQDVTIAASTDEPAVAMAAVEPARTPASSAPAVPAPPASTGRTIFFKPRAGTRRVLGVLLLVLVLLTGVAAAWAWSDRSFTSVAIALVAAVVSAVVWATRTSASPARMTLHGSELEIVRAGSRALFDLAHTQVRVEGQPGSRRWRVLLLRRSMRPYVIDASVVDPQEFMRVLRYFHREL